MSNNRLLMLQLLLSAVAVATSSCAHPPEVPDEYNFIVLDGAVSMQHYSVFAGREKAIYPEWFVDREVEDLIHSISSVAFKSNSFKHDWGWDRDDGQLFSSNQGAYGMGFSPVRSDEAEFTPHIRSAGDGWQIGGFYDEMAVKHIDAMYAYLVKGIENGQWVLDPELDKWIRWDEIVAGDESPLHPWDDVAQICRLTILLKPAKDDNPYKEFESQTGTPRHLNYIARHLYVDVYYRSVPDPDNEEVDLKVPHVFLFPNRTVTHIFELEPEWGKKFHDTAAKLHERLHVLYDELKQEPDEEQQSGSEDESDDD